MTIDKSKNTVLYRLSDKYMRDHGDRCLEPWATGCQLSHSVGAGLTEASVSARN